MGALVSASWLVTACGVLPQQAGNESYEPGFVRRGPAQAGYNGTIQDIPTSIDPRTPRTQGTPGRSLALDAGERALREQQQGLGGSGAGQGGKDLGGEGGSLYGGSGAEGAAPIPTERDITRPESQVPAHRHEHGAATGGQATGGGSPRR